MIALYILAGVSALKGLAVVSSVGKPRDPITPKVAVTALIISSFEIAALLMVAATL